MSDATAREMALEEAIGIMRADFDALRTIAAQLAEALAIINQSTTGRVGPSRGFIRGVARPALEAWESYQR